MICPKCHSKLGMREYTHCLIDGFVTYYYCRNCDYHMSFDWNKKKWRDNDSF